MRPDQHADSAVGVAVFGNLMSQHFALIPLYQLGRHHGMPSQMLRAVFAYVWVSLAYGFLLWAAYHFAAALSLPPRRAISVAWTTFATCLRWSSRITLGDLGFDFAILWVDRGAVPPDLSPYVMMAVFHARALTRVVGADLLARVLTPSVRGRLLRAVGGFGQPASSRGLAAIAALVTPALNGWSARRWCSALRRTGRGSVEANVLAAAGRFRGLPWSALEAHHLSSSLGSAELSAAAATVVPWLPGLSQDSRLPARSSMRVPEWGATPAHVSPSRHVSSCAIKATPVGKSGCVQCVGVDAGGTLEFSNNVFGELDVVLDHARAAAMPFQPRASPLPSGQAWIQFPFSACVFSRPAWPAPLPP